jgi:hypothetical protein
MRDFKYEFGGYRESCTEPSMGHDFVNAPRCLTKMTEHIEALKEHV